MGPPAVDVLEMEGGVYYWNACGGSCPAALRRWKSAIDCSGFQLLFCRHSEANCWFIPVMAINCSVSCCWSGPAACCGEAMREGADAAAAAATDIDAGAAAGLRVMPSPPMCSCSFAMVAGHCGEASKHQRS